MQQANRKWEDISTAPTDGTRVILFRQEWVEDMAVGYYSRDFEQWKVYGGTPFLQPTHWMELPEAPK